MSINSEKAQIMFELARKGNWENSYDRTEHFKRFQNLEKAIKELKREDWILIHKKPKFTAISLNPKKKKMIIEFIESRMSYVKGMIK